MGEPYYPLDGKSQAMGRWLSWWWFIAGPTIINYHYQPLVITFSWLLIMINHHSLVINFWIRLHRSDLQNAQCRGRFELSLGAGCGATLLLGAMAGLYSDSAVVMVGWRWLVGWWLVGNGGRLMVGVR